MTNLHRYIFFIIFSTALIGCDSSYKKIRYNSKSMENKKLNLGKWGKFAANRIHKDEPYANYNDVHPERLTFDMYKPYGLEEKTLPLLIFVHSGAFILGDKQNYVISKYCQDFCRTGKFATASINYRLIDHKKIEDLENLSGLISKGYTRKKIFEAVGDVKYAVKYFRDNAEFYKIDTSRIYLIGFSAGGIITHHSAFTSSDEANEYVMENLSDKILDEAFNAFGFESEFFKIDNISFLDLEIKTMVQGIISLGGGVLDYKHIQETELIGLPMLSIHGNQDGIVPYGLDDPFIKYSQNAEIPVANFYFDVGVKKSQNGIGQEDVVDEELTKIDMEFGVKIPDKILRFFINRFTSTICGSGCVSESVPTIKSYQLIELDNAPHVFMLNESGTFNRTYFVTRNHIFSFLSSNN